MSLFSTTFNLTILTLPPAAPSAPALLAADDSGTIGDGLTTVAQPHLVGTAPAGAAVQLVTSTGSILGTGTASAGGNYSIQTLNPLTLGTFAVKAQVIDIAGNVGIPSAVFNLTIAAPSVPAPTTPTLLAADDSGVGGDRITNVKQPRLTGTAIAGTTVQLVNADGTLIGSGTVAATGVYTIASSSPFIDGSYAIAAREIDLSGNISALSLSFTLTIDTTAPVAPTGPNLLAADDSGLKGDGITNVNLPHFSGTAEPGSTVQLINALGGVIGSTTATTGGSYTVQLGAPLPDGTSTVKTRGVDASGNVGTTGPALTITIITATPAAPAAPTLSALDDTGVVGDGRTSSRRPHLNGTAPFGDLVDLLDSSGNVLGTAAVASGGSYSIQPSTNLNTGTLGLKVRLRDAAGNVGPPGPALSLIVVDASISDFDGDGTSDLAVFRVATDQWIGINSAGGSFVTQFGDPTSHDVPAPADYDGLGHSELAVYRPGLGIWIINGPNGVRIVQFGDPAAGDVPVPGDYDGVGHAELAVFRSATDQWLISGPNGLRVVSFGDPAAKDIPVPGDYDGTGRTEFAVFRPATGQWIIASPSGLRIVSFGAANLTDIPAPGDYDGTGRTELAVFRPATGQWSILGPQGIRNVSFGEHNLIDLPVESPIGSLYRLGTIGGIHKASATVARATPQSMNPALTDTILETALDSPTVWPRGVRSGRASSGFRRLAPVF